MKKVEKVIRFVQVGYVSSDGEKGYWSDLTEQQKNERALFALPHHKEFLGEMLVKDDFGGSRLYKGTLVNLNDYRIDLIKNNILFIEHLTQKPWNTTKDYSFETRIVEGNANYNNKSLELAKEIVKSLVA